AELGERVPEERDLERIVDGRARDDTLRERGELRVGVLAQTDVVWLWKLVGSSHKTPRVVEQLRDEARALLDHRVGLVKGAELRLRAFDGAEGSAVSLLQGGIGLELGRELLLCRDFLAEDIGIAQGFDAAL